MTKFKQTSPTPSDHAYLPTLPIPAPKDALLTTTTTAGPEGYDSYEFSFNYEDDFFGNDADDGFDVPTDFFGTSVIIMVVASRFPYTRMCMPQPFSTLHPPLTYAMRIMCALALTCHGVLLCRVSSCDCMR